MDADDTGVFDNLGWVIGAQVEVLACYAGRTVIQNSGLIVGAPYGISNFTTTYEPQQIALVLKNSGEGERVVRRDSVRRFADRVVSSGLLDGSVNLGGGADTLNSRHGTIDGAVSGGAGADTFIGNVDEADIFDGGANGDPLIFRFGPAVTIALDGRVENDGAALGDTYTNIENIIGLTKADYIRGDGTPICSSVRAELTPFSA